MNRNLAIVLLIILVAVHGFMGFRFASMTPYRQSGILLCQRDPKTGGPQTSKEIGAPDERQHANYVARIGEGKGFAIFDPKDPNLEETYQGHQPPLYYLLGGTVAKLSGNVNPETAEFGTTQRLLNVLVGCIGVAGAFFVGLWGFGKLEIGVGTAAVYALLPMMGGLSGAVSNDPLLICLLTWSLAFVLLATSEGWNFKRGVGLAVCAALAILTKTTAVMILPTIFLAGFLSLDRKFGIKASLLVIAGVLVMVLPWWVRNQNLYGDPLALKAFNEAFVNSAQKSGIMAGIQAQNPDGSAELTYWIHWIGWWTARSFIGVFGCMDIWLNETGRANSLRPNTLYRLVLVFFALGGLGWVLALQTMEAQAKRTTAILFAFGMLILASFIKFNMQYFQAQGRYMLPAVASVGAAITVGWLHIFKQRWQVVLPFIAIVLLGVGLYAQSRLPGEFALRMVSPGG